MKGEDPSEKELVLISQERCDRCATYRTLVEETDIRLGPFCRDEPYIVELSKNYSADRFPPQIDREPVVKGHDEVEQFISDQLN